MLLSQQLKTLPGLILQRKSVLLRYCYSKKISTVTKLRQRQFIFDQRKREKLASVTEMNQQCNSTENSKNSTKKAKKSSEKFQK